MASDITSENSPSIGFKIEENTGFIELRVYSDDEYDGVFILSKQEFEQLKKVINEYPFDHPRSVF